MRHKPFNAGKPNHAPGLTKRLASTGLGRVMNCILRIVVITLFGGACLAQDGLVIRKNNSQPWPADAEKIYLTVCSAVERELRATRPLHPKVTLVFGAHENKAYWDLHEIRLTRWDPYLFAQGVVFFALDDMLPDRDRLAMAKRAVNVAGSTVAVQEFRK